jgi:transcription elongation factor Elf1
MDACQRFNEQKRQGGFCLLLDPRRAVAELMAECRRCGAMTTYGLELAWRLPTVTCGECGTSMRLTIDDLQGLKKQLIEARVMIDRLIDGKTHVAVETPLSPDTARGRAVHDDETY